MALCAQNTVIATFAVTHCSFCIVPIMLQHSAVASTLQRGQHGRLTTRCTAAPTRPLPRCRLPRMATHMGRAALQLRAAVPPQPRRPAGLLSQRTAGIYQRCQLTVRHICRALPADAGRPLSSEEFQLDLSLATLERHEVLHRLQQHAGARIVWPCTRQCMQLQ